MTEVIRSTSWEEDNSAPQAEFRSDRYGSAFEAVANYLSHEGLHHPVFLLDLDGTLRPHELSLWRGYPGEIPEESLELLRLLHHSSKSSVAIVTDRFPRANFPTRMLSEWLGYPFFPKAITEIGIPVFGRDTYRPPLFYKRGQKAVKRVGTWIESLVSDGRQIDLIISIGNTQHTDGYFAQALYHQLLISNTLRSPWEYCFARVGWPANQASMQLEALKDLVGR